MHYAIVALYIRHIKCCRRHAQRSGKLVAVQYAGTRRGSALWECRCDCGALVKVSANSLGNGNTRSCGCLKTGMSALAGRRFGRLVAVNPMGPEAGADTEWRCLCDCNRVVVARAADLTSCATASCGHCDC